MTHRQSQALAHILSGVASDRNRDINWRDITAQHRIDLPPEMSPEPFAVFILFVYVLEYSFWGQSEKTAWEIPLTFRGTPYLLAHRKFGFRIYSNQADPSLREPAFELIRAVNRAIPIAERLVQPYIRDRVNDGHVALENENRTLRSRYRFYRKLANRSLVQMHSHFEQVKKDRMDTKALSKAFRLGPVASNYVVAMLDAYYSWLEHVLVLLLPFVSNPSRPIGLSEFISYNWIQKYKVIFRMDSDPKAKVHFDSLYSIKEQYRNPAAHGNFDKKGSSFYVHMKGLGAVPMLLTEPRNKLYFGFGYKSLKTFEGICADLDAFGTFLTNSKTKYGMRYIEEGFSVAFDLQSRKSYIRASSSDQNFSDFMKLQSQMEDIANNMDW